MPLGNGVIPGLAPGNGPGGIGIPGLGGSNICGGGIPMPPGIPGAGPCYMEHTCVKFGR